MTLNHYLNPALLNRHIWIEKVKSLYLLLYNRVTLLYNKPLEQNLLYNKVTLFLWKL